jgi:hypothetical protein
LDLVDGLEGLKCIPACFIGIQENQRAAERSADLDTAADFHVENLISEEINDLDKVK